MSRQTYDELYAIKEKFKFLEDRVTKSVTTSYTIDEILDYENFLKDYDYDTDMYELTSPTKYQHGYYNSSRLLFTDKKHIVLANAISDIAHEATMDGKWKEVLRIVAYLSTVAPEPTDEADRHETFNSYYNLIKCFTNSLRDISTEDCCKAILSGELSDAETFAKFIYANKLETRAYDDYSFSSDDVRNKLRSVVLYAYDTLSEEQISKYETEAKKLDTLISKFFKTDYLKTISAFNPNLTEEAKLQLQSQYKSLTALKDAFSGNGDTMTPSNLSSIIDTYILENEKFKDKQFPVTKDKAVITIINMLALTKYFDFATISYREFAKKYEEYLTNPYFIANLLLSERFLSNTRTDSNRAIRNFIKNTFSFNISSGANSSSGRIARTYKLLDKCFEELAKPVESRIVPCKFNPNDFTISTITTIIYLIKREEENNMFLTTQEAMGYLSHTTLTKEKILGMLYTTEDYYKHVCDLYDRPEESAPDRTYCRDESLLYWNLKTDVYPRIKTDTTSYSYASAKNAYSSFHKLAVHDGLSRLLNTLSGNMTMDMLSQCYSLHTKKLNGYQTYLTDETILKIEKTCQQIHALIIAEFIQSIMDKDDFSLDRAIFEETIDYLVGNIREIEVLASSAFGRELKNAQESITIKSEIPAVDVDTILLYCMAYGIAKQLNKNITFSFSEELVLLPYTENDYRRYHSSCAASANTVKRYTKLFTYAFLYSEFLRKFVVDPMQDSNMVMINAQQTICIFGANKYNKDRIEKGNLYDGNPIESGVSEKNIAVSTKVLYLKLMDIMHTAKLITDDELANAQNSLDSIVANYDCLTYLT